ncbi:hypothetical protein EYF80_005517 [Liparis tanakae]|uniref:Uncharacterized protein n=1 Tax=Liparis tanakae TaxID=230148 RepID=A0A4Z2J1U1_9TELE|nr:hypothetical protein EYF80_005517 [Liparis tanakae]
MLGQQNAKHRKRPTAELTPRANPGQLTLGLYSHFRKRFIVPSPPSFVTDPSSPLRVPVCLTVPAAAR